MNPYIRNISICCLSFLFTEAFAQEVNITKLERNGSNVIVHYELIDEDRDRRYSLHLYSSLDNYVQPLKLVDGDIGIDIAVGANKKAIWWAEEELGQDFNGGVSLELQGTIYIPFIAMDGFEDYRGA